MLKTTQNSQNQKSAVRSKNQKAKIQQNDPDVRPESADNFRDLLAYALCCISQLAIIEDIGGFDYGTKRKIALLAAAINFFEDTFNEEKFSDGKIWFSTGCANHKIFKKIADQKKKFDERKLRICVQNRFQKFSDFGISRAAVIKKIDEIIENSALKSKIKYFALAGHIRKTGRVYEAENLLELLS